MNQEWIAPAPLSAGDLVAVIAPSSPFEHVLGFRGLAALKERYRISFSRQMFSRRGYLAGDDGRREGELAEALQNPEVKAILAARGGYGASRFVHRLDWSLLRKHPKWIVGFSDITALHVEAAEQRVCSIHGSHLTMLGRSDLPARARLFGALERPAEEVVFEHLQPLGSTGKVSGRLFGGNLTLVHACAAAGRLRVPDGAVLFLEDVTERPYRIDRMLTTLAVGGHFDRVAAILLGDFTSCDPGPDRVTVDQVLIESLRPLGVPLVSGLRSGHGSVNHPLVLGALAEVSSDQTSASLILNPAGSPSITGERGGAR